MENVDIISDIGLITILMEGQQGREGSTGRKVNHSTGDLPALNTSSQTGFAPTLPCSGFTCEHRGSLRVASSHSILITTNQQEITLYYLQLKFEIQI